MPSFEYTLVGLGPICDANCTVRFSKKYVTVFLQRTKLSSQGGVSPQAPSCGALHSALAQSYCLPNRSETHQTSLSAYSAYDLPSVESLVSYLHTDAGLSVKLTWLASIKAGNFDNCTGLTHSNASKYYPESSETIKGQMVQTRKGIRSTKAKSPPPIYQMGADEPDPLLLYVQTN